MKIYRNLIVLILALIAIVVGIGYFFNPDHSSKESVAQTNTSTDSTKTEESQPAVMEMLNKTLPEFSVTDISGQTVSSTQFANKPALIMEWASWCPYCQRMLPIVEEMYKTHGKEIEFVLINATDDNRETEESAQKYIKDKGFTFPYYFDKGLTAAKNLQVEAVPTMLFVDANGMIQDVKVSEVAKEDLEQALQSLLK